VRKHAHEAEGKPLHIEPTLFPVLQAHPWPGNVRELENVIRRMILTADDGVLSLEGLPLLEDGAPIERRGHGSGPRPSQRQQSLRIADHERSAIERALDATEGNVTRAAQQLGIARATVYRKMARYGIIPGRP
jgi:transcriptional regulator of acetoin/glycerol metabolism